MRPSRRRLLAALLCALPFAILGDEQADAIMMHGGMVSSGGTLLTTMTLSNATGSNDTPIWSKPFGHPFADQDLPLSGGLPTYPVFKIGGTIVPYSCSVAPTLHPSGCIRHMMFVLLLGGNFTIPANGTLTVNIYSGGSAPAPSSRTTADFTPADLKTIGTVMDNDTTGLGTYTASLNQGITAAKPGNYVWADGAAGKMWFYPADYRNGTTPEGNLISGWYPMSMQDASGNFGGILVQTFMTLQAADATPSTKLWKSFSALTLNTGATPIRDMVVQRSNTQVISPITPGSSSQWTATGNVIETGQCIRLTSSSGPGNLPGNFADNTSYFADSGDRDGALLNKMIIGTNSGSIIGGQGSIVTPSTAGTGTITATAYPFLTYYSKQFFSGVTGEYDFVQGGGSVSSVTVSRFQMNNAYWMASLTTPKYDLTIGTPTSSATVNYYMNTSGNFTHITGGTGERIEIGPMPSPYVRHLYTQSAIDERNVIVGGLVGSNMPVNTRNSTNGCLIPFNNGPGGSGSYTGMSSPQPTARWASAGSTSGFTPATANIQCTFDAFDASHRCAFAYYPFLLTGRPEYLDMLLEMATTSVSSTFVSGTQSAVISTSQYAPLGLTSSRNVTVSGVTRYGIVVFGSTQRQDAWSIRDIGTAAAICPKLHPQCNKYWDLFNDYTKDNAAHMVAIAALAPTSYASTNGLFYTQASVYDFDVWMQGYFIMASSLVYGMTRDANWLTVINLLNTWWSHYTTTQGAYAVGAEAILIRTALDPGPIIANDNILGFEGPLVTWSNGSANFTIDTTAGGTQFSPSVGDTVIFTTPNPPSQVSTPIPAAFTAFTPYYITAVTPISGNTYTIQLAATTPGGTPIVNSDSSTHNTLVWMHLTSPPATGTFTAVSSTGYVTNLYRSVLLSQNRGASFDATALTAIAGRQPSPSVFLTEPKFCFAA